LSLKEAEEKKEDVNENEMSLIEDAKSFVNDPEFIEDFKKFKKDFENSDKNALASVLFMLLMYLEIVPGGDNDSECPPDVLDTRLSFVENDLKNIKRIVKQLNKPMTSKRF